MPGCSALAHLTILPPRPLDVHPNVAAEYLAGKLRDVEPFDVGTGDVRVFDGTFVLFLEVTKGFDRLLELHANLASGPLRFEEPYPYHPHITLAQDAGAAEVSRLRELAVQRLGRAGGDGALRVDRLTFVQNTASNRWIDLFEYVLGIDVVRDLL